MFLFQLPEDLPFEKLLVDAKELYSQFPPESIENNVTEYDLRRRRKEQEWKTKNEAKRKEWERQRQMQIASRAQPRVAYNIRGVKTFTVVTLFMAIGIYAFLKSSSGLNWH